MMPSKKFDKNASRKRLPPAALAAAESSPKSPTSPGKSPTVKGAKGASVATAELLLVVGFGLGYIFYNVVISYFNNWVLSPPPEGIGWPAPVFYAMCNQIANLICATTLKIMRKNFHTVSFKQFWHYKVKLLVLTSCFAISVVTNAQSLPYVGIVINLTIKSCGALVVLALAIGLEGKRYSPTKIGVVCLIVAGSILAVPWANSTSNGTSTGATLSIVSMVCIAAKTSMAAHLMKDASQDGMTPMAILWYDALVSIFVSIFWQWLTGEWVLIELFSPNDPYPNRCYYMIAIGSFMSFGYNYMCFKYIQLTSSVTFALTFNAKLILVVVLPALFSSIGNIQHVWTTFLGLGMYGGGMFLYGAHEQAHLPKPVSEEEAHKAYAATHHSLPGQDEDASQGFGDVHPEKDKHSSDEEDEEEDEVDPQLAANTAANAAASKSA